MKAILISTSSLWNCGDSFIRNGVLNLLNLRPDVGTIWWNRAPGVRSAFANDLKLNIRHCDYFVIAGTPAWVNSTEYIYRYCLKNRIPIALLGVGTRGGIWNFAQKALLHKLAKSGLVEVCMARDEFAFNTLTEYGFKNVTLILDPAFFVAPLAGENKVNVLGWRDYRVPEKLELRDYGKRAVQIITGRQREILSFAAWYDRFMQDVFDKLPSPKLVVVHDNREIEKAEELFGKEYVFYSTNYQRTFEVYSTARRYIGSRIHGAIPSFIHGACVNVLYSTDKARVIENSREILSKHIGDIANNVKVVYTQDRNVSFPKDFVDEVPNLNAVRSALEHERKNIRKNLEQTVVLSKYIK